MYIIQMADLHIGSEAETVPEEAALMKQCITLIEREIPKEETILISLCGDIIDSRGLKSENKDEVKSRYQKAKKLVRDFKKRLEDNYQIIIKCCPGNHDATHMDELYEFVKGVDDDDCPSQKGLSSCYTVDVENCETKILFVNSCKGDQYQKGCIDYDLLEQELNRLEPEQKKIIILHHTVMSMFEEDSSPIRNAAKLITLIDRYNVISVLHGHIHGREILTLGKNQCKLIGTGALFTRKNANVPSQFNIIELKKNSFLKILNCRYQADDREMPWDVKKLDIPGNENLFIGDSFKKVYSQLIKKLDINPLMYNMRLEIKNKYDTFVSELGAFLSEDCLKIGEKQYTYFELAQMWQADDVPEELYFNHGSYYRVDDKRGIDLVIKQLKNKPTSNRIVLSTYNMKDVDKSLDDTHYLPSLVSIQFGKDGNKIIVHMHLRALEANRFLKINICEIHYLLKELKENAVEFDDIEIIISAFRVQKRDRFNCFLKAEIDDMNSEELAILVNCRRISKLCKLLEEKRDGQETITKMHGIQTLYRAVKFTNQELQNDNEEPMYDSKILGLLESVLAAYEELDKIHKIGSIQSAAETECEQEIDRLLADLVVALKQMDGVKS